MAHCLEPSARAQLSPISITFKKLKITVCFLDEVSSHKAVAWIILLAFSHFLRRHYTYLFQHAFNTIQCSTKSSVYLMALVLGCSFYVRIWNMSIIFLTITITKTFSSFSPFFPVYLQR